MEEDIKKCEEFINLSFLYGKLSFTKTQLYEYQIAIANLLTRYKEIKTEHRIMKRILVENNLWERLLNDDEFIEHLEN